jgi:hemerythrin superfamily protein
MNSIVSKMSPSATNMIRMDHMHVVAQFHKLTPDTTETVRSGALRSICAALEIHAQLEEELFYPALRECNIDSAALSKSLPEHEEMRRLIATVRSLEGQRGAQDDALNQLMNAVLHHVADEETQLLPEAEKRLGKERLSELGARMTKRRLELARPRAGELALDAARAAPAKTALVAAGALVAGTMLVNTLRRGRHAARS